MNKTLLLFIWFGSTFVTLIVCMSFIMLGYLHTSSRVLSAATSSQDVEVRTNYHLFSAVPSTQYDSSATMKLDDARVEIVRQFLAKYHSPLEPYAQNIIDASVKYNLDFRLVPAIAMQESNVCLKIPEGSHNCWGYGIYGGQITKFNDYPQAIETVSKGLSENYIYDGLTTPHQIMTRYTPSSNGSWANAVQSFMEDMQ